MSWNSNDAAMSAKHIAEYISSLEKRIQELSALNSKLARDNCILKEAITIIKDIDLSKIEDINQW
nr:MAG TPA: DNA-binding regulatory protein [Bacteriophage sp.]